MELNPMQLNPLQPNPLVGVVVPVRNSARWLDEMLTSLRQQTYSDWQAVVVDDGSDDGSVEIAERHQRLDPRITVVAPPGGGQGAPRVRAHGRSLLGDAPVFLYFPDSDDVLAPELIGALARRLESDPSAVAAFCRYERIDETGRPTMEPPSPRIALSRHWVRRLRDDDADTPFETLYGWAAPASEAVTMFRARAYDEAGGWGGWLRQGGESIDLLLRMALKGRVLFEPERLYRYRRHGAQHTSDAQRYFEAPFETRESWQRRARDDSALLPVVSRAEFFVEHRLIPSKGLEAALRHAKGGRLLTSTRFLVGAVRRYRWRPVG